MPTNFDEGSVMALNDNKIVTQEAAVMPDPHGHAALLLVESLIHGLCENATLSVAQAIDITERAVDVQSDYAAESGNNGVLMWRSDALLSAILASLAVDADKKLSRPGPI